MASEIKYKMAYLNNTTTEALSSYSYKLLEFGKRLSAVRDRMDIIDEAYARYMFGKYGQNVTGFNKQDGVDRYNSTQKCDISDKVISPIVVSQVDTLHAYLCDVFLSGYPIFPVASTYADRKMAEVIEAVIDDHAIVDRYPRNLKIAMLDAIKYNFSAVDVSWSPITSTAVSYEQTAVAEADTRKTRKDYLHINRLQRVNIRNAFWDTTVLPNDISSKGEFFGYSEKRTRIELIRHLQYLHNEGLTNQELKKEALKSGFANEFWNPDPIINQYLQEANNAEDLKWDVFFDGVASAATSSLPCNSENLYLHTKIYCRIIPKDFNLSVPNRNEVQIWVIEMINGKHLISAYPYQSPNDEFGVKISQIFEDGMGLQTQSPAETNIDIQEMVSFLMRVRIASSRRAIGDRAIYDKEVIHPNDINNPSATSKIPARGTALLNRDIRTAYYQIPFDGNSTAAALQDAMLLTGYAKDVNGTNNVTQGQFQKGNKSVEEFTTVMDNAQNRLRLLALTLEQSMYIPIKATIKYNLLSYGKDTAVTSRKTGEQFKVTMSEIIERGFEFTIADGYTPKSKIASTDVLVAGMNAIATNPILTQQLGPMAAPMFIHFMSLGGVKGIEEYMPQQPQQAPATMPTENPGNQ